MGWGTHLPPETLERSHEPVAVAAVSSRGAVAARGAASGDSREIVGEIRGGKKVQERIETHSNSCLLQAPRQARTQPDGTIFFLTPKMSPRLLLPPFPLSFSKSSWMQQEGAELEMGLYSHRMSRNSDFHSCCPQRPCDPGS